MAGSVSKFCENMRKACQDWSLGYDQNQRWKIYDGGECDCSSLVIWALKQAGFDVGTASYTGNMSSNLTARGWKRIPFTSLSQVRAGDILLNDSHHTAAVISGSGTTAKLAQASIDERGRATGGAAGDQTGSETNIRTVYNYKHGWDCILRYSEAGSGQSGTNAQKLESDGYLGTLSVSEWQRQRGTYVDGKVTGQRKERWWLGPVTCKRWQRAAGTEADGTISGQSHAGDRYRSSVTCCDYGGGGSQLVRHVQAIVAVDVDGDWRGQTSAGIQRYLKAHGFDCGPVDGYFGSESVKALCRSLDKAPQIWR